MLLNKFSSAAAESHVTADLKSKLRFFLDKSDKVRYYVLAKGYKQSSFINYCA